MNRTINRHLSKVVSNHQRDWDHCLPLFLLAYRSSVHETTGQTPVSIIMGRELRLPCDLKFGCPPGEDVAGEDYVTTLRRRMDDIHDQKSSGGKPRVVHFNRLTPFSGSNDASVRTVVPSTHEMSFENFMAQYSPNHKARYGVTREEQRDLFQVPAEFALAHCVAQDLQMSRGIAAAFKEKFGNVDELRRQRPEVGDVLQLGGDETSRRVFYLVTKHLSRDKPTYESVWESLISLRGALLSQEVTHLAIPKLSCGLDGLNWRVVRNMLEVLFQFTGIEVL
ncbi:hypothetical protein NQ317_014677, partial [Molorchus minor]